MKEILGFVVLATTLAYCLADCRRSSNGLQGWYVCEGLTGLDIPLGAIGVEIKNSNIRKIPADVFDVHGDSLVELNITESGVEEIEPNAFRGLGKLQVLSLVNNKIRKVRSSWVAPFSNLNALILHHNRIDEIEPGVYDLLPNLETLDVAYNDLRNCLAPESLKKLTKLRRILIAANPWSYRCRSSMTWYLGSNHIRFVKDWSTSDILIEDCLAHEPGADTDDEILSRCVDGRLGSSEIMRKDVAALKLQVQELTRKVSQLEADIGALKRSR